MEVSNLGPDPGVIDGLVGAYQAFKGLEKGNVPPSAAYWAAMADFIAQATVTYLNSTLPQPPPPDVPSMQAIDKSTEERRRRAAEKEALRKKIIETFEEWDREKEQHLPE
jgi:hypothetical protein